MHPPTDRIAHTTAFVAPVVEHWLEQGPKQGKIYLEEEMWWSHLDFPPYVYYNCLRMSILF